MILNNDYPLDSELANIETNVEKIEAPDAEDTSKPLLFNLTYCIMYVQEVVNHFL